MDKEKDLKNWEKDAPLLASLEKENNFLVPRHYFEKLSQEIINQIKIEELAGKDLHFQIPDSYFESLKNKIQSAILVENKKDSIKARNADFAILDKYFESNKVEIISKTRIEKSNLGKIISLKFIRYAAAACILLTTSFGIYFNIQRSNNVNYQLSKVSDEAIESYLKQTVEASDIPVIIENLENNPVFSLDENQLNDDDISAYLKTTL